MIFGSALKQQGGKEILVASPSRIVALSKMEVVDEYQLGVQPTIVGSGLSFFNHALPHGVSTPTLNLLI